MSYAKRKRILKLMDDIKNKTLAHDKLLENVKEICEKADKSFADYLIELLDEFDDKDKEINAILKDTLSKLGITPFYMNEEGIKKEDENDYDGAIRKYELCLKLDPKYKWAWYNMARMYQKHKNNKEKAIELYKKSVEYDENYADGWNNMGNVYLDLNQLSFAREAYEKALQSTGYKFKHFPYFNLGLVYDRVNNPNKALEFFLKAIQEKDDYTRALFNAGKMYKKLGEHEKANEYFAKTLQYDKTFEKSIRDLGVILEETITLQLLKKLDTFEPDQIRGGTETKEPKPKSHGTRSHGVR